MDDDGTIDNVEEFAGVKYIDPIACQIQAMNDLLHFMVVIKDDRKTYDIASKVIDAGIAAISNRSAKIHELTALVHDSNVKTLKRN